MGFPGKPHKWKKCTFSHRGPARSSVTQTAGTPYQPTYPNMTPRGLPWRRRERAQAPGHHLPRHRTILDGRLLRFVLLRDVWIPDVAFTETGR
jgi:hypothetical protein